MSNFLDSLNIKNVKNPFIILEAGINHNGNLDLAKKMISEAKKIGADAIKFQTFKANEFITDKNLIYTYHSQDKEVSEPMIDMFKRHEFKKNEWLEIKNHCDKEKIIFLSTPQNISDLDLLLELGIKAIKVGSDDLTNTPLLKSYAKTGLPIMLSTGMANLAEIYTALEAVQTYKNHPVLLMLCTSQYPTPPNDVNIRKLYTLTKAFPNVDMGFSDHTQGSTAAVLALAFGAVVFEKHFTLDNSLPGPDHWFSEDINSANIWIKAIREAKCMMGSFSVKPTNDEIKMKTLARRSITLTEDIKLGETFTSENLGLLRPGDGLKPDHLKYFIGKSSRFHLKKNHKVTFSDVN